MLGPWAAAALAVGLALGADRAEAASVQVNVTSFGVGFSDDAIIASAIAAQEAFHDGSSWRTTEDFENIDTGPIGDGLDTAVGTFTSVGGVHTTGTTGLEPHDEAHIRDGSGVHGSRYNTTSGGTKYLDSNDNGGIGLEILGSSGIGSFDKLSLLATDIDDVAGAQFSIGYLNDVGEIVSILFAAGLAGGPFPNGTLHLITFEFSELISEIRLGFMIDLNDGFGVDSFVISAVPLPPAALLFLTGLAGLGLIARRRRTRLGGAAA